MLTEKDYIDFHPHVLQKTNMCFDINLFNTCMEKYSLAFKTWGREKQHMLRYGLPLVNENGSLLNNPDPVCYPLDEWNRDNPNDRLLDRDFTTQTEVLSQPAFDILSPVKQYMLRSAILRWDEESFFWPHVDTWFPSPIVRLWGTTDPANVKIQFDKQRRRADKPRNVGKMNPDVEDFNDFEIEPGRLYVIDTSIIHAARTCTNKIGYQFFIALHTDCLEDLKKCIVT